jgi:hypothetical protein
MLLRDATLFRQQCYVAGSWIDADHGAVSTITNPAPARVWVRFLNWALPKPAVLLKPLTPPGRAGAG